MRSERESKFLRRASALATVLVVFAAIGVAQPPTLTTTFAGGSGHKGNMFDLEAIGPAPITLRNLDQNFLGPGGINAMFQVYAVTGGGSFVPHLSNPSAWTLLAAGPVTTMPEGTPTLLPFVLSLTIPPGTTTGFYVTCTNATSANVSYSLGVPGTQGLPFIEDANLRLRVGVGKSWPFGVSFTTRVWNGRITYCAAATCPTDFEANDAESSLDFDGFQGSPLLPAVLTRCQGATILFNSTTINAGLGWEAVIATSIPVSGFGPGLFTLGGQAINIDLAASFVAFLFGGATPAFPPHPGLFSAVGSVPAGPIILTVQQVVFSPAHIDGFAISLATGLDIAPSGFISGPTGDDTALLVRPGEPPLCGPATIPFFGTSFTGFQVISNGRIVFGPPDTDFSPTVAEALSGSPFAGAWCDLAPNLGGTITTSLDPAGSVRVSWNGVPYFGNSALSCTLAVVLDPATGAVRLEGLGSFPVFPVTGGTSNVMFLGLSAGAPWATDPGPTVFASAPPTSGPPGLGMLYAFGQAGTLASGVQSLAFLPNASGNYDWSAQ